MKFKIRVNIDFRGRFFEYIPTSFLVVEQKQNSKVLADINIRERQTDNDQEIAWQVNWQAGKEYLLSYTFDAPNISPALILSSIRKSCIISPI